MLKIKNAVVVVVLIFLKHNGLCGQVISSSQLCSQAVCVHFMCTVVTMHAIYEDLLVQYECSLAADMQECIGVNCFVSIL